MISRFITSRAACFEKRLFNIIIFVLCFGGQVLLSAQHHKVIMPLTAYALKSSLSSRPACLQLPVV